MPVERISLFDSLDHEWLKLPHEIMRDVGPATQTLAGLLGVASQETFVAVAEIARKSRLPVPTARKQLKKLHENGWIIHNGRRRTRAGHLRRTATIMVPKKTKVSLTPYATLPWWACCNIRKVGRLSWSAKAILSVVMSRLMMLKATVEEQDGHGLDTDDLVDSIEYLGGDARFAFSLGRLEKITGLTRESVIVAKRKLHGVGIVIWSGGTPTDTLTPNWDFRVVVTPTSSGKVFIDFERGSDSGQ